MRSFLIGELIGLVRWVVTAAGLAYLVWQFDPSIRERRTLHDVGYDSAYAEITKIREHDHNIGCVRLPLRGTAYSTCLVGAGSYPARVGDTLLVFYSRSAPARMITDSPGRPFTGDVVSACIVGLFISTVLSLIRHATRPGQDVSPTAAKQPSN